MGQCLRRYSIGWVDIAGGGDGLTLVLDAFNDAACNISLRMASSRWAMGQKIQDVEMRKWVIATGGIAI